MAYFEHDESEILKSPCDIVGDDINLFYFFLIFYWHKSMIMIY